MISRRKALGALALAGTAAAAWAATDRIRRPPAPRAPGALELPAVTFWGIRDPQEGAQLALAQALGLFAAEGLSVDLKWIVNGADLAGLVGSGQIDLFCESGLTALYASKLIGTPMRYVMPLADISGTQAVVLGPHVRLNTPSDLEGRRVGMPAGAGVEAAIRAMCARYGLDPARLTLINLQPPDQLAALARGDIDAIATWQPFALYAERAGGRRLFTGNRNHLEGRDEPVNWMYLDSGLLVREAFLAAYPNTVMAVMRALIRATDHINTSPIAATAAVLAGPLGMPAADLTEIMGQNIYTNTFERYMLDGTQAELTRLHARRLIPTPIAARDAYALDLLRALDPAKVRALP